MIPIRDTREQISCGLYDGESIRLKLDAGDYSYADEAYGIIELRTDLVLVERKASGSELASNMVKYGPRFQREMIRMKDTKFKILLIEDTLEHCIDPMFSTVNRRKLLCSLIDLIVHHRVIPIFAGTAVNAAEFCTTLFERIQKADHEGKFDND